METAERVFFFLHHYNEIDHRTPIIYKWSEMCEVPVDVILCSNPSLLSDYRIQYLSKLDGVSVYHVDSLFRTNDTNGGFRIEALSSLVPKVLSGMESIGRKLPDVLPKEQVWKFVKGESTKSELVADRLVERIRKHESAVLICDWTFKPITNAVIDRCDELYPVLSLPHGDSPFYNAIYNEKTLSYVVPNSDTSESLDTGGAFTKESINNMNNCRGDMAANEFLFQFTQPYRRRYEVYDFVVVPNELTANRWRSHLPSEQIRILGSPRFNDEWLSVLEEFAPEPSDMVSENNKLNVVFFLRDPGYFVFTEMVEAVINLLVNFDNLNLIVKEHTSGQLSVGFRQDLEEYSNCNIVDDNVHSVTLLSWGDVFLDIASSIVFEAIQRNDPILALEFVHSNHSTIAQYLPDASIQSLDQLYRTICHLLTNNEFKTYSKKQKKSFVKNIINPNNQDVLEAYVKCINTELQKN